MRLRAFPSVILWPLILAPRVACQDSAHVERSLGWRSAPISAAAVDGRIRQAAAEYRQYAPIPRIALFDIAFPKDSAEGVALADNAVLLVTAIVQDSTELPVRRLYLAGQGLAAFATVESHVADTTVGATFGRYRMDALYMVPLGLLAQPGDLLLDFAAHRQAFRVGQLSGEVPPYLSTLSHAPPPSVRPSASVLWQFTRREYPDLGGALAPR